MPGEGERTQKASRTTDTAPGNATLLSGGRCSAGQETGDLGERTSDKTPLGWHSRGYLPHFDGSDCMQHVTIHLADSLPKHVVKQMEQALQLIPEHERDSERRKRIEAWIDAGHGRCDLRHPDVAAMVELALLFFDQLRYRLLAWVVMPNHVHILVQPLPGWTLAAIVASWKKFTAARIADCRRHRGESIAPPIWHREYWDRYIRDERHYAQTIAYIHDNPVKAGLCATAHDWPWSSDARAPYFARP
jgi:REP element-mobilizing transposase RayT